MADFNMDNVYTGDDIDNDIQQEQVQDDNIAEELFDEADFDVDDESDEEGGINEEYGDDEEPSEEGVDSSPNLYRSVAEALSEDGVLTATNIDQINTPDDLRFAIEEQIRQGISDQNKRIHYALSNGVRPDEIKNMESIISQLQEMDSKDITDESDEGVENRKSIIYNGCLANGLSEEQAKKEVNKSMKAGSDIEDARYHLDNMMNRIKAQYNSLVNNRKREQEEYEFSRRRYHEELADSIINGEGVTGNLSKKTRHQILANLSRATEKLNDGRSVTPIQKFQAEYPADWQRITAELFTITDGFRDFSVLGRREAQRQINKGMANLEKALKTSSGRFSGGSYKYANNLGGSEKADNSDIEY